MVRQVDKLGDVCSHPDPPPEGVETVRCDLCMKPLVAADAYEQQGKHFCCAAAAEQFFATGDNLSAIDEREKAVRRRARIRRLVIILIIVLAGVAAAWYYVSNKEKVDERMNRGMDELRDRAGEVQESVRERQ